MAMNRQQKRMLQKQGQLGDDGEPAARKRTAPAAPRPTEQRTTAPQFLREVRGELRKVARGYLGVTIASVTPEIAEARGVSRASVSTLVAQLLAKGLIRQEAEAGDRRRKGLSVTAKGRASLARLEARRRRANRALLAELGAPERALLLHALRACLRCAAASVVGVPGHNGLVRQLRRLVPRRVDHGDAVSTSVFGG